jgi:hypothetical protein
MKKLVPASLAIAVVLGGFIAINHGYAQEDNQNTGQVENNQTGNQKKECDSNKSNV